MRKIIFIMAILAAVPNLVAAQKQKQKAYQTFIYTSNTLPDEIQRTSEELKAADSRGLASEMGLATLNAGKGIASGYVTSFVDMGVKAIASLVTRNSRLKEEWTTTVKAENTWSTQINTVEEVKDFYQVASEGGALDPRGMRFDGIGCVRTEGKDTLFLISCHIDRSKLYRIVNHSKFELVLDTLIVSPTHSNLPNTNLPLDFSFEERKDFNLNVNIKLTSSWFTDAIELHNNEQLGEFTLNITIDPSMLDENGFLRYVRKKGEPSRYHVTGESFIVPRSYMGYRDEAGNYHNIWGTGEYKVSVDLKETCDITDSYRKDWKNDRKRRKEMMKSDEGLLDNVWKTVSNQKWDELTQSWTITTLSAPAGVLSKELISRMGLDTNATASTPKLP